MLEWDFARHALYDLADAQKSGNLEMMKKIQETMGTYDLSGEAADAFAKLKNSMQIPDLQESIKQKAQDAAQSLFNSLSQ